MSRGLVKICLFFFCFVFLFLFFFSFFLFVVVVVVFHICIRLFTYKMMTVYGVITDKSHYHYDYHFDIFYLFVHTWVLFLSRPHLLDT